jgi:hypothetical protein
MSINDFNNDLNSIKLKYDNSNNGQIQIFNNMLILSKYYSKLHLVSYLYLQFINNLLFIIFILTSFISGLFETINYKHNISNKCTLFFGIIEIILAFLLIIYKYIKLPENSQDHYHYSNEYQVLSNNINTNIVLINSDHNIYSCIIECIKQTTLKLNSLINEAPIIPNYILNKYNIKNIEFNYKKNFVNDEKLYEIPLDNIIIDNSKSIKNNENLNQKKYNSPNTPILIRKGLSINEITKIPQTDIDNYNNFINKVIIKNEEKYNNNKIINFRKAFE